MVLICAGLLWPMACPAPLIYVPGEGWHYEPVGGGASWTRTRAKDQLEVAKEAFAKKDYSLALKAAKRTASVWPFSDYAAEAQFMVGACYEAKKKDQAAFKAYQKLIKEHPKQENYDEVVRRQFEIANRFLNGQWFKAWNFIPLAPSMERTIKLYEDVIKNGPYSAVAPKAQMNIAAAYENKVMPDYESAAKAYEKAADRYSDQPIGVDALFLVGVTYHKLAKEAEYDQSVASKAINTFSDFVALHPKDARVDQAKAKMLELQTEQARGAFEVARFYEKRRKWHGASVYYNEVLDKDAKSSYADEARVRLEAINQRQRNEPPRAAK